MKQPINYKLWNNITGALVFLASAFIYLSTLEPTVSFWDCGEFLSCDAKLEIAHPSGAPMVMLIRHVASLLGGSNPKHITLIINGTSAIASALTIMFLFWTITWFGKKILSSTWQESNPKKILILAAGIIGAMAYAVSDSFWFSAVEAEVYAMSSLFTAAVFWCILKWEEVAEEPGSERWLMLIAYICGLSIGVHLLNLLAIPAIVILFYLKSYQVNRKNTIKAVIIAGLILGGILYILIPGLPKYFSWIELIAVNSWSLPYNSGFVIGGAILIGGFGFGLYISRKKQKIWLYNSIIYIALIILGFSSFGAAIIRSHDNPPVDMGNPEDPFSLENYLNREQYGQRPFLYGHSFASPMVDNKERKSYQRFNGEYVSYPLNPTVIYDKNTLMLFPRMASEKPEHVEAYKQWTDFKGRPYYRSAEDGKQETIMLPTFGENMTFFMRYQLGFMYMRYFMWNFAGRQNDIQGHGTALYGNWISGIPFIDNLLVAPQDKFPASLKQNKGRNVYFFLPLLLGLIGLFFHYKKDKRNFSVLALLFFFTGIAIVIFLNEEPVTPRERDYVYVGSFYAFCVWIGIGVIALAQWFEKTTKLKDKIAIPAAIVLSISVPWIMTSQNWDDHDRSGRYAVLEYARNYLESCEPNAILFTNADNDTYPLWYAQEVEGIRRDVRIVLLPYLSAFWYVDQLRKPMYDKPGLAISLSEDKFIGGLRSYLPIIDRVDSTKELSVLLQFAGSEDQVAKVQYSDGQIVNFVPSHKWLFPVNKQKVTVKPKDHWPIENMVDISLRGNYLRMDQLVLLDIIASNNWQRPVYFASIQEPRTYGLDKYLQLDGYAYKLTPYKSNPQDLQEVGLLTINSDALYDKYMNRYEFASLGKSNVYLDWTHVYTVSILGLREKFVRLAEILIGEGKKDKAIKVLDKITTMLPHENIPYNYEMLGIINGYFLAGQKAKGEVLLRKMEKISKENLQYYRTLPSNDLGYEIRVNLVVMQQLSQVAERNQFPDIAKEITEYCNGLDSRILQYLQMK
jgi:hypothetical protein